MKQASPADRMDGERIVFTGQSHQRNDLNLIAVADMDGTMLEALEDYVKRQKKRLGIVETKEAAN